MTPVLALRGRPLHSCRPLVSAKRLRTGSLSHNVTTVIKTLRRYAPMAAPQPNHRKARAVTRPQAPKVVPTSGSHRYSPAAAAGGGVASAVRGGLKKDSPKKK